MACRSLIWVTFCTCVVFSAAIPTRRQFVSITETTSSEPSAVVTNEGAVWDENDDFDLDGDEEWLGDASPSSAPQQRVEYEEYDDDEDEDSSSSRRGSKGEDEDIDQQDAEEDESDAEFLFMPSRETRLVLQDDDDQSGGTIKVRHTGKNSYPEVIDSDNSVEDSSKEGKSEDSQQHFEFTIDNDEEDDSNNGVGDDKDDFVLEDSRPTSKRRDASQDDDDEDEDNFVAGEDGDDDEDPMFENPEEDSQVIYGDHLFLY